MHPNPAPAPAPHEWSKDALFAKSQLYAEEMFTHTPDDWRFVLWSTLALELLARAALSSISPALLADAKDWNNVYFAFGHEPRSRKFVPKSIDITSVFARLQSSHFALDPRLESFGVLHMQRRNEEVHSGGSPLSDIKSSTWLPTFYETCKALLQGMGESLGSMFDSATVTSAEQMITAARDESAKAVRGTIVGHKTVWDQKEEAEQDRLRAQASVWAARHLGHRVECPACGSDALVTGVPTAPAVRTLEDDNVVERQAYVPTRFECVACTLKINALPQLHAADLADTYTSTTKYDASEYYAPESDEWEGYEPDNNEPLLDAEPPLWRRAG